MPCTANHSCDPNAVVVFDGARLAFRALKHIPADKEIFISYIDTTLPHHRRTRELLERYYFHCSCEKCQQGPVATEDMFLKVLSTPTNHVVDTADILGSSSDVLNLVEQRAFDLLQSSRKELDDRKAMTLINEGLQACMQTKVWPEYRQPLASLRDEAFMSLITPQARLLSLAFKYGWKLYFEIHPIQYPQPFHPVRIIHKWRLALLTIALGSYLAAPSEKDRNPVEKLVKEGVDFGAVLIGLFMEFQDNVKRSHGSDCEFARQSFAKINEVKADMTRGGTVMFQAAHGNIEKQWKILRKMAASRELNDALPDKLD